MSGLGYRVKDTDVKDKLGTVLYNTKILMSKLGSKLPDVNKSQNSVHLSPLEFLKPAVSIKIGQQPNPLLDTYDLL